MISDISRPKSTGPYPYRLLYLYILADLKPISSLHSKDIFRCFTVPAKKIRQCSIVAICNIQHIRPAPFNHQINNTTGTFLLCHKKQTTCFNKESCPLSAILAHNFFLLPTKHARTLVCYIFKVNNGITCHQQLECTDFMRNNTSYI